MLRKIIYLGDSQKGHFPLFYSHKTAINLSKEPITALWSITGLANPVFMVESLISSAFCALYYKLNLTGRLKSSYIVPH